MKYNVKNYVSKVLKFVLVVFLGVLSLSRLDSNKIIAANKNVSSDGISHYEGVPSSFYKGDKDISDVLDFDITIWDHRQDAIHFQAGTLNNGFEQGLLKDKLGTDGFPIASEKNPLYPANDFTSSSSRSFSSWWTADSNLNGDFSAHNGWERSSLPNGFGNGTPENFFHYKDMQDFYDTVIAVANWGSNWDIRWMKTGNYIGWYNFKDGFYAPMNSNSSGATDSNGIPLEYYSYNVSLYKSIADPTSIFTKEDGYVSTMTNLEYPRWYFEVDNMNDNRSDDRSAEGVGFGEWFLYNAKERSENYPINDDGGLGAVGAFDQAFPGVYENSSKYGKYAFTSGSFPNYNTELYSFYSSKEQTAKNNLVLEPVKGHLTLKYDSNTKTYVYDSDENDYNGTSGFYPLNVGTDGVTLYNDEYRNIASKFSYNDMTLGTKTTQGIENFDWTDELWSNELATDDNGETLNFHFSVKGSSEFTYYGEGESFTFSGDDDFWLYIDDQLVIDLGGTHGELSCTATFLADGKVHISPVKDVDGNELTTENVVSLNLKKGQTYSLDFFYAERHTHESNLMLSTNLRHDKFSVEKTGTLNEDKTDVSYLIKVTNEMEDMPLTIVKIADWMNLGDSYNDDGRFIDFNTKENPIIEFSTNKEEWVPLSVASPSTEIDGFKVLSTFSKDNTQPGIDLDAKQSVFFRYTYTLTEEDYENGEVYNKFSVTTKNPADDDAMVEVNSGGTGVDISIPSITKVFVVEDGVTVPETTFEFKVSPLSVDGITYNEANMPSIPNAHTSYSKSSTDMTRKRILVALPDFTNAGIYVYKVEEVQDTYLANENERMHYSNSAYYLRIHVVEDMDGNIEVASFEYSKDEDGIDIIENMVFINTYEIIPDDNNIIEGVETLPTITKDFKVELDQTIPAATFKFSLEPIKINTTLFNNGNMPTIENVSTSYTSESRDELKRNIEIILPEFTEEGVYIYKVTEISDTYELDGTEQLTYSSCEYYLHMVVLEDKVGNFVVAEYNYSTDIEGLNEVEGMIFTNYYFRHTTDQGKTPVLILTKTTTNEISESADKFDFNVIINSQKKGEANNFSYVIVNANGSVGPEIQGFYDQNTKISLGNGDYVYFKSLPEDATYNVSEEKTLNYDAYYSITEGGVKGELKEGTTTGVQILREDGSIVDFVNEFRAMELPETGHSNFSRNFFSLMTIAGFIIIHYQSTRKKDTDE